MLLLRRGRLIYVPHEGGLDLAGVAKAWAATEAARRLGHHGPALVDAGGDVAVTAPRHDSPGWPIAVEAAAREWVIARGGVATCGRDYRRWTQGTAEHHHIIDPRTGEPAVTDLLTATVAAPTLLEADVSARAALILGSEAGAAWLAARPHLTWLLARED
jgi:thiamine biosynthesis lipoprotein